MNAHAGVRSPSRKSSLKPFWDYIYQGFWIACLMAVGDLFAQLYSGAKDIKSIKWMRTVKYASIGMGFIGPTIKYWLNIIRPWLANQQQNYAFASLKGIVNVQLYLAPTLNLGVVFLSNLSKSDRAEDMGQGMREKYISVMKSYYKFWPAIHMFSKFLIKRNSRIFFHNIMAIWWFTYLSLLLDECSEGCKHSSET
uniref:Mitochondrial inner membrane protein Mpv17 n=1 Tax=Glossina austeni TaxID=7395 RepID=A0A1A9VQ73_GLOAU